MPSKLLILVVNTFVIMTLTSTFIYSVPLDTQDIGNFYCLNGTNPNLYCCPLLAHRISSNSKSVILTNKSGYNMSLVSVNLEHGRWVKGYNISCEPQTNPLENGQSETFSSIPDGSYYNMEGFATFVMDDDISSTLTIIWKTSFIKYYFWSMKSKRKYDIRVHSVSKNNDGTYNTELQQITVYPFRVRGKNLTDNASNSWNALAIQQ